MGREIRRVPPNWEHPIQDCPHRPRCDGGKCYRPLYDQEYDEAAKEWLQACIDWANGKGPSYSDEADHLAEPYYWDYGGMPPDKDSYRPKWTEEPAHYQVYQNVSEGTPVTPHFATKEELIDYLVRHGDYWDQKRGDGGWDRAAAERFVEDEFCPSMIAISTSQGVTIQTPGHMTYDT